jgi:putative addiction module component (TIGR02574 family)
MRTGLRLEGMASRHVRVEELTAEERIELMGRLWDSLDPATAAPMTDALTAELDRREAEADAHPEHGKPWSEVKEALRKKLR